MKLKHGSLFSGIGGFDLASEWMGWDNVFHCEWNDFGQKILKYYWPKAISYENICTTDFTVHRGNVDIITGGFPCQPFSLAGKRKGTEDTRYLWPEMLRVIREVRPKWVVGENVYGLVNWDGGVVFDTVCADLENEGFKVIPIVLPAASVGAPHKRDRIWFIAYSNDKGRSSGFKEVPRENEEVSEWHNNAESCYTSDESFADTECSRLEHRYKTRNLSSEKGEARKEKGQSSNEFTANGNGECYASNTTSNGRRKNNWFRKSGFFDKKSKTNDWENFPTVSPICIGNDGISNRLDSITFPKWRKESIKAGGNAIVPQVALQIFKTIEKINDKILC